MVALRFGKTSKAAAITVALLAMTLAGCGRSGARLPVQATAEKPQDLSRAHGEGEFGVEILYPEDETLFPPDIASPTFRWESNATVADKWFLEVSFSDGKAPITAVSQGTDWTPTDEQWEAMKARCLDRPAWLTVEGLRGDGPQEATAKGRVSFSTSRDEVGAPIFYREVHLPFLEAVRDPATFIRWRFGHVGMTEQPPVVLEGLPNCANCHSFSADGSVLAMEVDSANDKGSYVIAPVDEEMVFDNSKIMTWSDYKREDEEPTFGLLAQISPDGRYVICMVKDRSVFVPRPSLDFSQLFFPIRGILVYYDRATKQFAALPGADDPELVQANPTWSPDGQYIVFARQKAHYLKNLRNKHAMLLTPEECREFLEEGAKFQYDLYRVPFNEGRGGEPFAIEGASANGMSNYFPKYSPDGKWIVFCKARSFMLLQPDSELYIIPAAGGEARRLRGNTRRMNSWHSWSPNGKWLVFSSKANSAYTQLFLTHIDPDGLSTPAVLLSRFTAPNTAANIPEFVNTRPGAIKRIGENFLDDRSFSRAAYIKMILGDIDGAERTYRTAVKLNPENANVHFNLATILIEKRRLSEAGFHCREALRIDPEAFEAHLNLGRILVDMGKLDEATEHLREAIRLRPNDALAAYHLASALEQKEQYGAAVRYYAISVENRPDLLPALLSLASIRATAPFHDLRGGEEAVELAKKACEQTRFSDAWALDVLAAAEAELGRYSEAVRTATMALQLARSLRDQKRADAVQGRIELYRQEKPFRRSAPFDP